jgi:hypothetical protein
MSSTSKGKGAVKTREWAKHLKPFGKKQAAKDVRNDGKKQIKDSEEDEQSIAKQMKKTGKATIKGPNVKERKKFAPATKVESPKKGKGSYDRKETFGENTNIANFIDAIFTKNYADADKYIKQAVESKLQLKIEQELTTPLFQ